jgi:hypothetical protein
MTLPLDHTVRTDQLRARAARRVADDTTFISAPLAYYQRVEGRSPSDVADELGVSLRNLDRLALCRRPTGESFAARVYQIADYVGANVGKLANILRLYELTALTEPAAESRQHGLLLAARTRPPKDEPS